MFTTAINENDSNIIIYLSEHPAAHYREKFGYPVSIVSQCNSYRNYNRYDYRYINYLNYVLRF